jgi:hypothetical protein
MSTSERPIGAASEGETLWTEVRQSSESVVASGATATAVVTPLSIFFWRGVICDGGVA